MCSNLFCNLGTTATKSTTATTTSIQQKCSVVEQGSGLSKPCQFPFVYAGQSYDKCIFKDNGGSGKPWCSTKTDKVWNNVHLGEGGHYGDCSQDLCPVVLVEDEFVKWKDQNTVGKYQTLMKENQDFNTSLK